MSLSLMDGWLPTAVHAITAVVLVRAIGWRSRRWAILVLPMLAAVGVAAAVAAHWGVVSLGVASEPAPWHLWLWVTLTGLAAANLVARWRGDRWSRRNVCAFATSLCLLSVGLTVNGWIGYVPTVATAWNQVTDAPLPDEVDAAALRIRQHGGSNSDRGAVVRLDPIAEPSGFEHRPEYVYLPPAWFTSTPPPRLPAVMMIGGQFNTPADWIRAGNAIDTLDAFARDHGGNAPVAVFVDPSGSFANDTECVNGPRGNAADHLAMDVVPRLVADFNVSARASDWGGLGFSSGGTCAVDLAVMHPESFSVFVDIAGDLGPNAGTREQTIERLYGGDASAWARFDPTTVMTKHGAYADLTGLFVVPAPDEVNARTANALCDVGTANGVTCTVVPRPGRHVWPFGGTAFAATLPWLAGELGTPGVAPTPVPESGV
jgi:S-formylglutathione hydrolase FrmB